MHETVAKQQHPSTQPSSSAGNNPTSLSLRVPKRPAVRRLAENSESRGGVGSPQWERYNLFKDVVVRAEVMGEAGFRKAVRTIYAAVGLGFLALVVLVVMKFNGTLEDWNGGWKYFRANFALGLLNSVAMLVGTGCYLVRIASVTRRGFRWGARRKRQATLNAGLFVTHTINSLVYLVTNAVVLYDTKWINCPWFRFLGVLEYTMWNNISLLFVLRSRLFNLWLDKRGDPIGRKDALLVDAPWGKHGWLFGLWVGYETVLLTGTAHISCDLETVQTQTDFEYVFCTVPESQLYFVGVGMALFVVYHGLGVFFIYNGYKQLVRKPYNTFRGTHLTLRYHFLCFGTVDHLVVLSFLLLFSIRLNSCSTGVLIWFGVLPCHFLMTVLSLVMIVLVIPLKPGQLITFDVTPSTPLAWQETQLESHFQPHCSAKLGVDERGNSGGVEVGGVQPPTLTPPPPFCFETSVKLWYWSLAVYGYDPALEQCFDPKYQHMSLDVAMAMYELKHFEYIEEKACDTKAMVAWNDHMILVCFRGTYSATNVWTDLQFWRTVHSPCRGSYLLRTQPLVHKGFIKSWAASNLDQRILNAVIKIVHGREFNPSTARVLVTGHSLGGALAVLASLDIARYCGIGAGCITCYTYGAPRVGNHAFAREYDSLVPDTWQVINDEDLIPRMPKFWILFKHVGNKVIINQSGDMIVKPYMVEVSLYRMFTFFKRSSSMAQHLLLNYRKSFVAICEAQFMEGKALKGGMQAMLALLEGQGGLLGSGLGIKTSDLHELHSLGKTIWQKKRKRREKKSGCCDCLAENGCATEHKKGCFGTRCSGDGGTSSDASMSEGTGSSSGGSRE